MKVIQVPMHSFASNCYIVETAEKNAAVIDPGNEAENIIKAIDDEGLSVKMILLTHGHFDHIGAVQALVERYGCQVFIHEDDMDLLGNRAEHTSHAFKRQWHAFTPTDKLYDGQIIKLDEVEFKVMHTPGHTKGGVCIICGEYIFTGDTLFDQDIGRTDLYGGDYSKIVESLRKLAKLPGEYTILPGHEESGMLSEQRSYIAKLIMKR